MAKKEKRSVVDWLKEKPKTFSSSHHRKEFVDGEQVQDEQPENDSEENLSQNQKQNQTSSG